MIFLTAMVGTCSEEPEDPGNCSLSCGNAIIGSNDPQVSITAMTEPGNITCENRDQTVQPVRLKFLVSEKVTQPSGKVGGAGTEVQKPVPFVSFEPNKTGVFRDVIPGNTDPKDEEIEAEGAAYLGVITPKSNWCSDACGVISVELAPACPAPGETNEVTLSVSSGPLGSETMKFSVTTKDEE